MNAPICRRSGILLHPTSLPNPFGSGDFGASAYHFVDWLQAGSQKLWQMLPLNGVGPGNSPYMSPSAFAGNELLIDLEALKNAGWLDAEDLIVTHPFPEHRVDFHHVRIFRSLRLRLAAQRFFSQNGAKNDAFVAFCQAEKSWLDDYALFMSLDAHYGIKGAVWQDWEPSLVKREPKALAEAAKKFADDVQFWQFCQWNFYTQWAALKAYANARGVSMIGDVPIFISPHSADVWANQHLFDLEPNGRLKTVAGVPPDYFSANGQHWGNPLYRWEAHKKDHYAWWSARLKIAVINLCCWWISPYRAMSSRKWVSCPTPICTALTTCKASFRITWPSAKRRPWKPKPLWRRKPANLWPGYALRAQVKLSASIAVSQNRSVMN